MSSPKAAFASERAEEKASDNSSAEFATFMPRPPPPEAALTSKGKPISTASFCASSIVSTAPGEPGTRGSPAFAAVILA